MLLLIGGVYSGLLTAVFTVPRYEKPIDTPEDALHVFNTGDVYPSVYVESALHYFLMVGEGELIVFSADVGNRAAIYQHGTGYTYISKESFFTQHFAVPTPSGSPYQDVLSEVNNSSVIHFDETLKSFLELISKEFTGSHMIVVTESVSDTSDAISYMMNSVPLSLWTSESFQITKDVLKFCQHIGGCVIVGLLRNQHAVNILRTVHKSYLESINMHYVFVTGEEVQSDILPLLREGTRVTLFEGNFKNPAILNCYQSVWTKEDVPKFESVGICTIHEFGITCDISKKLGRSIASEYWNFEGRHIKVGANNYYVYLACVKLTPECGPDDWHGADYEHIKYFSKKLNFTFELTHHPDNIWGGPQPDGKIIGLIGMVARHEVFMAVHEVALTGARESVIDYVYPYYTEISTLASKEPQIADKPLLLLAPYTALVWGIIMITVILVATSFAMIDRTNKKIRNVEMVDSQKKKFTEYLFPTFRLLMLQPYDLPQYGASTRVLLGVWMAMVIALSGIYSGLLTAVLAVPRYEKPIDTPEEALQVLNTDEVYPSMLMEGVIHYFLQDAESGVFREMYEKIHPEKSFLSHDIVFKKVGKGELVVFGADASTRAAIYQHANGYIYISKENFFTQHFAVPTPSGSPYKDVLSEITFNALPFGLHKKWVEDAIRVHQRETMKARNITRSFFEKSVKSREISLEVVQTAFYLWFLGIVIAAVIFALEHLTFLSG